MPIGLLINGLPLRMQNKTTEQINPYAPTKQAAEVLQEADSIEIDKFVFEGVIEESDYGSLMPNQIAAFWVHLTLLYFAFPLLLVMTILYGIFAILLKDNEAGLGFIVLIAFTTLALLTSQYFTLRSRVARSLKRYVEILGPLRGTISPTELIAQDEKKSHWFGPRYVAAAEVSPAGIRIPLSTDPYHYIALSSRHITNYDPLAAKKIVENARENFFQISSEGDSIDLNRVSAMFERSGNAIAFQGIGSVTTPTRTWPILRIAITRSFQCIAAVVIPVVVLKETFSALVIVLFFFGSLPLGKQAFQFWRRYYDGSVTQTWQQAGWISNNELVVSQHADYVVRFPLEKMQIINKTENSIEIHYPPSPSSYLINASHFESLAEWLSFVEILESHASIESSNMTST